MAPNAIKEVDPEKMDPSKYNVAMNILDQDATDGEGMVIRYQDYESEMSRSQFADFTKGVSNVTKMLAILNVYRPALFDKLDATVQDPGASMAPGAGPDPSAEQAGGLQPASVAGRSA